MIINLQLLIRQLDSEGFLLSEDDSSKGYIRNVSLFDPESPLLPSYAYLLESDDAGHLKDMDTDPGCAFIVLYNEGEEFTDIPLVHNVLKVRTGQKLHAVLNKVQQVFDLHKQSMKMKNQTGQSGQGTAQMRCQEDLRPVPSSKPRLPV